MVEFSFITYRYRELVRLVLYIEDGQSVGVADTIINIMALLLSLLIDFYISWKNSSKFKSMIIVIYSSWSNSFLDPC